MKRTFITVALLSAAIGFPCPALSQQIGQGCTTPTNTVTTQKSVVADEGVIECIPNSNGYSFWQAMGAGIARYDSTSFCKVAGNVRWNGTAIQYCDGANWQGIGGVPSHVVEAFNLANCPAGWSLASYMAGRFILGAGNSGTNGSRNHAFGSQGGAEDVSLSLTELPSQVVVPGNTNGWGGSNSGARWVWERVIDQGGGQPFSTMPPYTTLIYCEKN